MVEAAAAGLVLALSAGILFGGREEKQPDPRALQAEAWDTIAKLLHRREEWASSGVKADLHDEALMRVLDAAPSILAQTDAGLPTLKSLSEVLSPALHGAPSLDDVRRVRQNVEELLLLAHGLPSEETRKSVEPLKAWLGRMKAMTPLAQLGPTSALTVQHLRPGDHILADGVLHLVDSVDFYREEYMGQRWEWHEASLTRSSDFVKTSLAWEVDDGLEFSMPVASPSLAEAGLNLNKARSLIEEEEGRVSWNGKTFVVQDGGTALFYRGGAGPGEEFDYISLSEPGGLWMDIEDWGDEVEVTVSRTLLQQNVQFLRGTI